MEQINSHSSVEMMRAWICALNDACTLSLFQSIAFLCLRIVVRSILFLRAGRLKWFQLKFKSFGMAGGRWSPFFTVFFHSHWISIFRKFHQFITKYVRGCLLLLLPTFIYLYTFRVNDSKHTASKMKAIIIEWNGMYCKSIFPLRFTVW